MIVNCGFYLHSGDYGCSVNNTAISVNEDQLKFQGNHANGKLNNDVKVFNFFDCSIPQIPQTIGDTFKNLEELVINFSKLKSITKYDLKQFENLKVLDLNYNVLEFLPGDLFEFTNKLEKISFSGNKIKYIGPALLDNLPHLKTADFAYNTAIDKFYSTDEKYGHVSKMTTLDDIKQHIQTHCKPPQSDDKMQKLCGRN